MADIENSATIGTAQYSLAANTSTGVPTSQTATVLVQVWLDLQALAAGDVFEFKVYGVVAGGAQGVALRQTFSGPVGDGIVVQPALKLKTGWDITMVKLGGTDRSIGWSIREI